MSSGWLLNQCYLSSFACFCLFPGSIRPISVRRGRKCQANVSQQITIIGILNNGTNRIIMFDSADQNVYLLCYDSCAFAGQAL